MRRSAELSFLPAQLHMLDGTGLPRHDLDLVGVQTEMIGQELAYPAVGLPFGRGSTGAYLVRAVGELPDALALGAGIDLHPEVHAQSLPG